MTAQKSKITEKMLANVSPDERFELLLQNIDGRASFGKPDFDMDLPYNHYRTCVEACRKSTPHRLVRTAKKWAEAVDRVQRIAAADLLKIDMKDGDPLAIEAMTILAALSADTDPSVVGASIQGYSFYNGMGAADRFDPVFDQNCGRHSDAKVREHFAALFPICADVEFIEPLLRLARDPSVKVRTAAVWKLGMSADGAPAIAKAAREALKLNLNDMGAMQRFVAKEPKEPALPLTGGRSGDPASEPLTIESANTEQLPILRLKRPSETKWHYWVLPFKGLRYRLNAFEIEPNRVLAVLDHDIALYDVSSQTVVRTEKTSGDSSQNLLSRDKRLLLIHGDHSDLTVLDARTLDVVAKLKFQRGPKFSYGTRIWETADGAFESHEYEDRRNGDAEKVATYVINRATWQIERIAKVSKQGDEQPRIDHNVHLDETARALEQDAMSTRWPVASAEAADVIAALDAMAATFSRSGLEPLVKHQSLVLKFDVAGKAVPEAKFFADLVARRQVDVVPAMRRLVDAYIAAVAASGNEAPYYDGDSGLSGLTNVVKTLILLDPGSVDHFARYLDTLDGQHDLMTWETIFAAYRKMHGLKTVDAIRLGIVIAMKIMTDFADPDNVWTGEPTLKAARSLMSGAAFADLVIEAAEATVRRAHSHGKANETDEMEDGGLVQRAIKSLHEEVPAKDEFSRSLHQRLQNMQSTVPA